LIEDPDLYRFLYETVEALGAEFVHLKDGRDPWQVFSDRKYMGNTRLAHCTLHLKGDVFKDWLLKSYPSDKCVLYLGFGIGERHRLATAQKNWEPYTVKAPLLEPPYTSRAEILNILEQLDIEIPRLYKLGFSHNNCGGFCVKAGTNQFKLLLDKLPDVYKYHEDKQEELKKSLATFKPFLRINVDKKTYYLTLKEFRELVESGKPFKPTSDSGCGCFTDTIPIKEIQ